MGRRGGWAEPASEIRTPSRCVCRGAARSAERGQVLRPSPGAERFVDGRTKLDLKVFQELLILRGFGQIDPFGGIAHPVIEFFVALRVAEILPLGSRQTDEGGRRRLR